MVCMSCDRIHLQRSVDGVYSVWAVIGYRGL